MTGRPLASDEVLVCYQRTESLSDEDVAALDAYLSNDERRRRDRYRLSRDRRDYASSHALLRTTLARCGMLTATEYRFHTDANGKPWLISDGSRPQMMFNLSHTDGLVTCAVARGTDVGVDVEHVRRRQNRTIARRYFSAPEVRMLEGLQDEAYDCRFVEIWTLKEAYVKGQGRGLSYPFNAFGFSFDATDGVTFTSSNEPRSSHWQFALIQPTPMHRLSVAVRCSDTLARCRVTIVEDDPHSAARERGAVLRRTRGTSVEHWRSLRAPSPDDQHSELGANTFQDAQEPT